MRLQGVTYIVESLRYKNNDISFFISYSLFLFENCGKDDDEVDILRVWWSNVIVSKGEKCC